MYKNIKILGSIGKINLEHIRINISQAKLKAIKNFDYFKLTVYLTASFAISFKDNMLFTIALFICSAPVCCSLEAELISSTSSLQI
jgi:hypothetical protein